MQLLNSKKTAFTLSEVLLVLSVIGVVSALTIPTLVQKISDDQYKAAWKKNFSILSQTTNLMLANNGGNLENTFTTDDSLKDEYAKNLSFVKHCTTANMLGNCWHLSAAGKYLNGNTAGWAATPGGILSDGTLVRIGKPIGSNAAISAFSAISVDVNGFKGPNTVGKDVYYVWITNTGVRPWGVSGDTANDTITTCVENSTAALNTGNGCSAKYLFQ